MVATPSKEATHSSHPVFGTHTPPGRDKASLDTAAQNLFVHGYQPEQRREFSLRVQPWQKEVGEGRGRAGLDRCLHKLRGNFQGKDRKQNKSHALYVPVILGCECPVCGLHRQGSIYSTIQSLGKFLFRTTTPSSRPNPIHGIF